MLHQSIYQIRFYQEWVNASRAVYDSFIKRYKRINDKTGKEQFVVPYLMSSHPGSTMKEAIELAEYVRDLGYMPEQVQDFLSHTVNTFNMYVLYRL